MRPLPGWIDDLYGHLAEPIGEAYAIVESADDRAVTAALAVERASPAWSRLIADLRDVRHNVRGSLRQCTAYYTER